MGSLTRGPPRDLLRLPLQPAAYPFASKKHNSSNSSSSNSSSSSSVFAAEGVDVLVAAAEPEAAVWRPPIDLASSSPVASPLYSPLSACMASFEPAGGDPLWGPPAAAATAEWGAGEQQPEDADSCGPLLPPTTGSTEDCWQQTTGSAADSQPDFLFSSSPPEAADFSCSIEAAECACDCCGAFKSPEALSADWAEEEAASGLSLWGSRLCCCTCTPSAAAAAAGCCEEDPFSCSASACSPSVSECFSAAAFSSSSGASALALQAAECEGGGLFEGLPDIDEFDLWQQEVSAAWPAAAADLQQQQQQHQQADSAAAAADRTFASSRDPSAGAADSPSCSYPRPSPAAAAVAAAAASKRRGVDGRRRRLLLTLSAAAARGLQLLQGLLRLEEKVLRRLCNGSSSSSSTRSSSSSSYGSSMQPLSSPAAAAGSFKGPLWGPVEGGPSGRSRRVTFVAEGVGSFLLTLTLFASAVSAAPPFREQQMPRLLHLFLLKGRLPLLFYVVAACTGLHFNPALIVASWLALPRLLPLGLSNLLLVCQYAAAAAAAAVVWLCCGGGGHIAAAFALPRNATLIHLAAAEATLAFLVCLLHLHLRFLLADGESSPTPEEGLPLTATTTATTAAAAAEAAAAAQEAHQASSARLDFSAGSLFFSRAAAAPATPAAASSALVKYRAVLLLLLLLLFAAVHPPSPAALNPAVAYAAAWLCRADEYTVAAAAAAAGPEAAAAAAAAGVGGHWYEGASLGSWLSFFLLFSFAPYLGSHLAAIFWCRFLSPAEPTSSSSSSSSSRQEQSSAWGSARQRPLFCLHAEGGPHAPQLLAADPQWLRL
ncbi:hypothetical protein Efla_007074 [Eimeria flavescens]